MNIIITMAGLGSRFAEVGYSCPKYMIEAKGKTLFEWSMDSLVGYEPQVLKYVFIVRKEHNARAFIEEKMKGKNIEIIEIDYLTDGQATTALIGVNACDDRESVLIYNIDTYIEPNNLRYEQIKGDGFIPCFKAEGTHWSFVKEENGKVTDVVEKVRISDNCSLGAYYFSSAHLYKKIYESFYGNKTLSKEKYIAPMYKAMLDEGYEVSYVVIPSSAVHVLGTPEELEIFLRN